MCLSCVCVCVNAFESSALSVVPQFSVTHTHMLLGYTCSSHCLDRQAACLHPLQQIILDARAHALARTRNRTHSRIQFFLLSFLFFCPFSFSYQKWLSVRVCKILWLLFHFPSSLCSTVYVWPKDMVIVFLFHWLLFKRRRKNNKRTHQT